MKLRIKGNSIRLRLLRSEVELFAVDGHVSDETHFGGNALRYSLLISNDPESIAAKFDGNEITVSIPEKIAREWAVGDAVTLENVQTVGDSEPLAILIEKDFACLDRPDDPDRDDTFPNPQLACAQPQ